MVKDKGCVNRRKVRKEGKEKGRMLVMDEDRWKRRGKKEAGKDIGEG